MWHQSHISKPSAEPLRACRRYHQHQSCIIEPHKHALSGLCNFLALPNSTIVCPPGSQGKVNVIYDQCNCSTVFYFILSPMLYYFPFILVNGEKAHDSIETCDCRQYWLPLLLSYYQAQDVGSSHASYVQSQL